MTQTEKGQFVQFPLHLIYGCPDLNRDDKWVLLAIMGSCWTQEPRKLSYRTIEALSGVPVSLLSSFTNKKTGEHHEGIIDRLARLRWIAVTIDKDTDPISGKPCGNAQSFISINYTRIWQENLMYCQSKMLTPVSYTNRLVSNTNTSVSIKNTPVSYTNEGVSNVNEPVSISRLESHPYITVDNIDTTDNIDKEREGVAVASPTSSSPSQIIDPDLTEGRITSVKKEVVHGTVPDSAPGSTHLGNTGNSARYRTQRQDTNTIKRPPVPDKSHINATIPKRPIKQGIVDTLPSEEARRIMDDWDSLFSRPCTRTENHIKAAELLVPCHPTKDDLSNIRKFCYSSNPKWYREKGVSLQDVAKNFDKWQSLQEAPPAPTNGHSESNGYRRISSFDDPNFTMEHEFYPSEKEKREYYAAQAAQQGVKA